MKVRFHRHAQDRLRERGATEEEVITTIERGEQFPAKHGRNGFRSNFPFHGEWNNNKYATKQIEAYDVAKDNAWLVISAIVKFLMAEVAMRLSYDPKHNLAYIGFHEQTGQVTTVKISEDVNIDIAQDRTVYGIELLNANEQLGGDRGALILELSGQRQVITLAA